jgi:integrase
VERPIARALSKRSKPLRLRLISTEQTTACYRRWTAPDAEPREALLGLLALVHCLRIGEIRALRMHDLGDDRLSVGERVVHLAEPVAGGERNATGVRPATCS